MRSLATTPLDGIDLFYLSKLVGPWPGRAVSSNPKKMKMNDLVFQSSSADMPPLLEDGISNVGVLQSGGKAVAVEGMEPTSSSRVRKPITPVIGYFAATDRVKQYVSARPERAALAAVATGAIAMGLVRYLLRRSKNQH